MTQSQPEQQLPVPFARGEREPLPAKRKGYAQKVRINYGAPLFLHTGEYKDGRLGEIFLTMGKAGTFNRSVLEGFAVQFSISLQYGASLQDIIDTYKFSRFEPMGATDDPDVPTCSSIFDYVVRRLEIDYLGGPNELSDMQQGNGTLDP